MKNIYKVYYRERGVRYPDRLILPSDVKFDAFPKSSLFHYVPTEHKTTDEHHSPEVDTSSILFQGYNRKILLEYVDTYIAPEGPVRRPMFDMKQATRQWKRDNVQKWAIVPTPWKIDHSPESLIVLNYGYLDVAYKYLPMPLADYYRWKNRQKTIWTKVNEIAAESERHQFLIFPLPSIIQGRAVLARYEKEPLSIRTANIFGQAGWPGYMQLDLWRWLSDETRSLSLMSAVDPKHYTKINLVFEGVSGNQWIVNLGYLNSWIKGHENTTDMASIIQYRDEVIQKTFLKLCMVANAIVTDEEEQTVTVAPAMTSMPPVKEKLEPEAESPDEIEIKEERESSGLMDDGEDSTDLYEPDEDVSDSGYESGLKQKAKTAAPETLFKSIDEIKKGEGLSEVTRQSSEPGLNSLSELDKDIEALDKISLTQLKNAGVKLNAIDDEFEKEPVIDIAAIEKRISEKKSPLEILKSKVAENAEANLLTAAEYRKLNATLEEYVTSEDPYGSKKPRVQAMVIEPDDVIIKPEETDLVVSDVVQDKSMASSSIKNYDSKYLKRLYKKDVLNAVDSIQAAGVVIKKHEIDTTHSALGSYEHHTLEIKPIDGASSIVRFSFPKVDEDGTFMASGNRYVLRKQRVD